MSGLKCFFIKKNFKVCISNHFGDFDQKTKNEKWNELDICLLMQHIQILTNCKMQILKIFLIKKHFKPLIFFLHILRIHFELFLRQLKYPILTSTVDVLSQIEDSILEDLQVIFYEITLFINMYI